MSARRFRTAIMLAAILGQAVPSTAKDAGRSPSASATDTGDAFYCGERRLGYWFYCVRPKHAPSGRVLVTQRHARGVVPGCGHSSASCATTRGTSYGTTSVTLAL